MSSLTICSLITIFLAASCNAYAIDNRIVGGKEAERGQFPYQVYITFAGNYICGGSIYNERYIITSARCINLYGKISDTRFYSVHAGTVELHYKSIARLVKRIIVHEKWNNYENDIALLELKSPYKFNDYIQPIELYDGEISSGKNVIISGFGGPGSEKLKYNTLSLLTQPKCGEKTGKYHSGIVCVEHKAGNGACHKDAGGPAVVDGKLLGVANFVTGGCGTGNPDGYALIPFFADWIKENTV